MGSLNQLFIRPGGNAVDNARMREKDKQNERDKSFKRIRKYKNKSRQTNIWGSLQVGAGCMCSDIFLEPCGAAINTVIQLIIARHKSGVPPQRGYTNFPALFCFLLRSCVQPIYTI